MDLSNKKIAELIKIYNDLEINKQIDNEKFNLYSIITHSTAIEGSTITEIENQLLFDEKISVNNKTIAEQLMNLDLKAAYEYGYKLAEKHEDYSEEVLRKLASIVMARTGSEYQTALGAFSSTNGDFRLLNVTAGFGGRSYLNYSKIKNKIEQFCKELNDKRHCINKNRVEDIYNLSFWAHYILVNIHPWADGNGRMSRLIMNMIQREFSVIPMKVLKEDKAKYIQSLNDSYEKDDITIFIEAMNQMHANNLRNEISNYLKSIESENEIIGDKSAIKIKIGDKKQAILNFIKEKGSAKAIEVSEFIGLSPSRTRDYLKELVSDGHLKTSGANKNRVYY